MKALAGVLGAALLLVAAAAHGKATVVIVNADAPDAGFNDPTPVAPVGGNTGQTLGAQRLLVFQTAAEIWGNALDSVAPITVLSHFEPLACDSTGATLGSAGPTNIFASDDTTLPSNVSGSVFPKQKTWYVSALTARFAGTPVVSGTGTASTGYDILARFNSALDDPGATNCGGLRFYYGLDNNHGGQIDLLTVVLHEFGHGLGFLSLADSSTGEFQNSEPDIWAYYMYDESSGQHWVDMDAAGRKASAISGGLAWDGDSVKTAVPNTLYYPPLVRVTAAPQTPSVVKDYGQVTVAQFSGQIGTSPLEGQLGVGSTGWGCTALGRLAPLDGKIAILDRGGPSPDAGCTFVEKARNAQDAGAIGLLIANNTATPPLITPAGTAPDITIPVLLMTQADGTTLKEAADAGTVTAQIVRDPSQGFQGADSAHRALLFAPSPLQPGSSVSHWDTSAFPNLLMEPIINGDLTHSLDLTLPLFNDIGWLSVYVSVGANGPSSLADGQQGTFTFTVANPGPNLAPAVTVSDVLNGLSFVSNSGDCTSAFPCVLGDMPAGASKTITTTLKASGSGQGSTTVTAASGSSSTQAKLTVTLPGTGGGGATKSGCTTALGPPAPWVALLGLAAFVRRRRRA